MIPVFEPLFGEPEIAAVVDALRRGEISGSFGEAIPAFEKRFAEYVGCRHGVAVTSGTTALQLAVQVAGIGPGDEVLMSASTNIATGLAAYHNQAVPVAVDSEETTWNLNLELVEPLISRRTKAIIPVHLFGHPVDMDQLGAIARRHGLIVIEDCAESHGATVRGRMTGGLSDMGCFSFYANKIITTGEGGMVVTNNDRYAEQLRLLRNLAFTQPRFRHEQAGHNFRMTGYQAAMGCAQISRLEQVIAEKRRVAHAYHRRLREIRGVQLPAEMPWARNVYWMYAIEIRPDFGMTRDDLMARLKQAGIETRTFFCPMNIQPCFQAQPGFRQLACPVAERIWRTGLYLPSSPGLKEDQIDFIADAIRKAAG